VSYRGSNMSMVTYLRKIRKSIFIDISDQKINFSKFFNFDKKNVDSYIFGGPDDESDTFKSRRGPE
jgi:hypothetical protein